MTTPSVGARGSRERRVAERRAIIDACVEVATGVMLATLESEWIPDDMSPLGSRRHRAVVRLRLARGLGGAARIGRRYLLTVDALVEEFFGQRAPSMRRAARALVRRAVNDNGGRA